MASYYDLVLGAIPAALIGITAVMTYSGFTVTTAVPVASLVVLGVMGHAMFVNAPVESTSAPSTPGAGEHSSGSGSRSGVAPPNAD